MPERVVDQAFSPGRMGPRELDRWGAGVDKAIQRLNLIASFSGTGADASAGAVSVAFAGVGAGARVFAVLNLTDDTLVNADFDTVAGAGTIRQLSTNHAGDSLVALVVGVRA